MEPYEIIITPDAEADQCSLLYRGELFSTGRSDGCLPDRSSCRDSSYKDRASCSDPKRAPDLPGAVRYGRPPLLLRSVPLSGAPHRAGAPASIRTACSPSARPHHTHGWRLTLCPPDAGLCAAHSTSSHKE